MIVCRSPPDQSKLAPLPRRAPPHYFVFFPRLCPWSPPLLTITWEKESCEVPGVCEHMEGSTSSVQTFYKKRPCDRAVVPQEAGRGVQAGDINLGMGHVCALPGYSFLLSLQEAVMSGKAPLLWPNQNYQAILQAGDESIVKGQHCSLRAYISYGCPFTQPLSLQSTTLMPWNTRQSTGNR